MEDSLEYDPSSFKLFEAYREGNLDCDVINTQKMPAVPKQTEESNYATSNTHTAESSSNLTVIPRSWYLPPSTLVGPAHQPSGASVSFGSLCKQHVSQLPAIRGLDSISVGRKPAESVGPSSQTSPSKLFRGNAILVNARQRGNPLLHHIHNVAWEFADIEPDYVVGRNHCVFFLSLRYHNLNSEYISERVKRMKQHYQLSVLLCQVDVVDPHYPLKELCKFCLAEKLTLMLAWNPEEAARYLEAYKALELKPPEDLMPETAQITDPISQITDFFTAIRPVTKTDAASIVQNFKSVADVIQTDSRTLEKCPGFGRRKAQKLNEVFRMPFVRDIA